MLVALSKAPWQVGVIAGVLVLLGGRLVLPQLLAGFESNPYLDSLGRSISSGAINPLLWLVAAVCWLGAGLSWIGSKRRRRLLDTQSGLDSLRTLSWRDFERLVGEAFRRQGYAVEETGLGGADGGIDVLLRRDGRKTLVQCKQWKAQSVGVAVVREQFGLLTHHNAAEAILVTAGKFTADAYAFARGKPIRLIDGPQLAELVRGVQSQVAQLPVRTVAESAPTASSPDVACPRCGAPTVQRTARSTGSTFLGCSRFPRCKGLRSL